MGSIAKALVLSILLCACTVAVESNCPNEYTPDNIECAWYFCQKHPRDSRCLDSSIGQDGSSEADTGQERDASDIKDSGEGGITPSQCDGPESCPSALPYCGASGECVACTMNAHCPATDPVCSGNRCVGCSGQSDCSARATSPACNSASGDCVECTEADDSACTAGKVCKAGGNECAECNTNAQCELATKPICDDSECRGCTTDQDCSSMGKICREATGECVACKPNKDDPTLENCANGNACDPTTFTCAGQPRRSLGFCGKSTSPLVDIVRCVSDSECIEGHRCVPTEFPKDTAYGSYCLRQIGSAACPNRAAAKRASSILGVVDSYCFPNDTFTTCEGVLGFKNLCNVDDECGAEEVNDGLCRDNACTYGCDAARDCSGTNNCIGPQEAQYCNPN